MKLVPNLTLTPNLRSPIIACTSTVTPQVVPRHNWSPGPSTAILLP